MSQFPGKIVISDPEAIRRVYAESQRRGDNSCGKTLTKIIIEHLPSNNVTDDAGNAGGAEPPPSK